MPYSKKKPGADAPDIRGMRILVADADCALYGLLEEWFAPSGAVLAGVCQPDELPSDGYDVIVADVPFPRQGGMDLLKGLAIDHPRTPIVVLSDFFPGVECCGPVARELGVAAVVPKPVTREALMAAVRQALKSTQ